MPVRQMQNHNGETRIRANDKNGEIYSIKHRGTEWMHDGGAPSPQLNGWKHSEISCLPIFGPASKEGVDIFGYGTYALDQHGILRHVPRTTHVWTALHGQKIHTHAVHRRDQEYPFERDGVCYSAQFPFSFNYVRTVEFEREGSGIVVNHKYTSPETPGIQFGWHPAFQHHGLESIIELEKGRSISVGDIQLSKKGVCEYADVTAARLITSKGTLELCAYGTRHMVLWSLPGHPSVAIEPVTHVPERPWERLDATNTDPLIDGKREYRFEMAFLDTRS